MMILNWCGWGKWLDMATPSLLLQAEFWTEGVQKSSCTLALETFTFQMHYIIFTNRVVPRPPYDNNISVSPVQCRDPVMKPRCCFIKACRTDATQYWMAQAIVARARMAMSCPWGMLGPLKFYAPLTHLV